MADPGKNRELAEAIEELQQYLSDTLPPLVVADAVGLLLKYPPGLVASNINAWTAAQYRRGGPEVPVSDYLFHAVKKIQLMGEFRLVPREGFGNYLEQLKREVLNYCPEGDREFLKTNLDQLAEASASLSSPVEVIFRQATTSERRLASPGAPAGAAGEPADGAAGTELVELRRVSLLLDRLEREALSADPKGAQTKVTLASQALAAVARSSQNEQELKQALERLRSLGLEVGTREVLRSLSSSLPGWVPPLPIGRWSSDAPLPPPSPTVEAIHRVVTETEDPGEGARRFNELVRTAVEHFNEGSLAQAVAMIELAQRIIAERRVDPIVAEAVRGKADEGISVERLRKYAETPDQHANLRRVLNFFTAYTPEGLLASLRTEPKRERRRLLLLLIEAHGPPARQAVFERLNLPIGQAAGDEDWYFRRNLLYLLRRIPRASLDEDVDIAVRHTELRLPGPLVREAIVNLGQLKHERAERTLMTMLQDLEAVLSKPGDSPYDAKEMRLLLDRVVAALSRFGTVGARRAVVEHGLKGKKEFGDTMARLAELAGQDLSDDGDSVDRLLEQLKSNSPFKLFGLVLHQNDRNLSYCIEALSGTPHPSVQQALQDLVKRFSGQEIARAASKALAGFRSAAPEPMTAAPETPPAASLSGDLELFGLPTLMQSLAESRVTGSLTVRDAKGEVFGTLALSGGRLAGCLTGMLTGEEAFYQLLERPLHGSFLFAGQPGSPGEDTGNLREVLPLTFEGMRRYDELQQAAALVPDEVVLKPTDVKPAPHPNEKDGAMVKDLWSRVAQGATARQCETNVRADSYRIRRLLAHWVEQGALTTT